MTQDRENAVRQEAARKVFSALSSVRVNERVDVLNYIIQEANIALEKETEVFVLTRSMIAA